MNEEDIKYLNYEGLQEFKQRLDLQILSEKLALLSEINKLKAEKADIDDLSSDVIIEDANDHEYVEIAGIKWATCNVGALNPDDDGLYFAWGETTGYEDDLVGVDKNFSWDDYELTEDSGTTMSKYNNTDEKTVLELTDDPATVNMGGTWRTPTKEEWEALGEAVNTEWTNDYNETGVSGLICTDKTDSSKVLFLPAAGGCYYGSVGSVGSSGLYWSCSLDADYGEDGAYGMYFNSDDVYWDDVNYRCRGFSVRGVLSTVQQKILGTSITDAERSYWNSKANTSDIPTKVSDLTNDSGYLTSHLSLADYATKQEVDNKIGNLGNLSEAVPAQGEEGDPDYVPAQDAVPHTVKSYVDKKITDLVGAAPETLDTLKEIADALGDNDDTISTLTNTIAAKANSADVYAKTEIDNKIGNLGNIIDVPAQLAEYLAVDDGTTLTEGETYYTSDEGAGEFTALGNEVSDGTNYFILVSAALPEISHPATIKEYVDKKANLSDLEELVQTIEDNEEVIAIALNSLNNKSLVTAVSITANTSSSCTITGNGNSGKEELIIYRNTSGSDLVVTVPTTYVTPNGSPIELLCKNGGYCEVNYININGTIYARGL